MRAPFSIRRGILCSWCGREITPGGARIRLHRAKSVRASDNWIASFHVPCGEALLAFSEARVARTGAAAAGDTQPLLDPGASP